MKMGANLKDNIKIVSNSIKQGKGIYYFANKNKYVGNGKKGNKRGKGSYYVMRRDAKEG